LFQRISRCANVAAKFVWALLVDQAVPESVRSNLMTIAMDVSHKLWESARDPAEHEKNRTHLVVLQQPQHAPGVRFHSARELIPSRTRHVPFERGDLKVVFDVDREDI
jgi:hypothetical protein